MVKRGITQTDIIAALTNASEKIATKSNRLALFSTVNNRYLLVIPEKVNNEDMIITASGQTKRGREELASLKYDERAKALYLKLSDSKIIETESVSDSIFFDIAEDGSLVGVEVILPKDMPEERVKKLVMHTK